MFATSFIFSVDFWRKLKNNDLSKFSDNTVEYSLIETGIFGCSYTGDFLY